MTICKENPECITEALVHESCVEKWNFLKNIRTLTGRQFNLISNNKSPQGIIGVIALPADCYSAVLPEICGNKVLLLEDIQDPGNVGTLIRTAAAFNFSGLLFSKECADPFSPKVVQASAGSISAVWMRITDQFHKLAIDLKSKGFSIIASDMHGSCQSISSQKTEVVLALGNEGKGLSKKICDLADTVFTIPINTSSVESLNVAVAGAIGMYLLGSKQKIKRSKPMK